MTFFAILGGVRVRREGGGANTYIRTQDTMYKRRIYACLCLFVMSVKIKEIINVLYNMSLTEKRIYLK